MFTTLSHLRSYIFRLLLQESHREQLSQLTDSLNSARQEIETLCRQEQDAALASAETKQKVHEELLKQEEEMIKLRAEREKLLKEGNVCAWGFIMLSVIHFEIQDY